MGIATNLKVGSLKSNSILHSWETRFHQTSTQPSPLPIFVGEPRNVEPFLKRYIEEPDDGENTEVKLWMESLARFRVEIRRMFGPSNEVNAAIRITQYLRQKRSASEYSTQFQQYAAKTDWDDITLMTMYRRGLKENVKDELMRFGGVIDTLDQLIENAIKIDDKLFERSMEKRHNGGTSGEGRSTFFQRQGATAHDTRNAIRMDPCQWNLTSRRKIHEDRSRERSSTGERK